MMQVVNDLQAQKKKEARDPAALKTLSTSYDAGGLAGYVAATNRAVEVDGGPLSKDIPLWRKRHTRSIDLNPGASAPFVAVPVPLARGYGLEAHYPQSATASGRGASSPIAVVELVLGNESPPFYTNDHGDDADHPLTFMQAIALVQHVMSPMLTQLLGCVVGDPAVPIPSKFEDKLDIPDQPNQTLGFPEKPLAKKSTPATLTAGGAGPSYPLGIMHGAGSISGIPGIGMGVGVGMGGYGAVLGALSIPPSSSVSRRQSR